MGGPRAIAFLSFGKPIFWRVLDWSFIDNPPSLLSTGSGLSSPNHTDEEKERREV